jgi:hypothetical protein
MGVQILDEKGFKEDNFNKMRAVFEIEGGAAGAAGGAAAAAAAAEDGGGAGRGGRGGAFVSFR